MKDPTLHHSATQEHRALAIKCADLMNRVNRYRAIHPVTIRGMCRVAGIKHHQPISEFFSSGRATINHLSFEKIDDYLKERGF